MGLPRFYNQKIFVLFFLIVGCRLLLGQPKGDQDWSKFGTVAISDDGNFYMYALNYQSRKDTLFVESPNQVVKHFFPMGTQGQFSPDSKWFACRLPDNETVLVDLRTGVRRKFQETSKYTFTNDGRYVAIEWKSEEQGAFQPHKVMIIDLETQMEWEWEGITDIFFSPTSTRLAYAREWEGKKSVSLFDLVDGKEVELIKDNEDERGPFIAVRWNAKGDALFFFQPLSNWSDGMVRPHRVYYYSDALGAKRIKCLDPEAEPRIFAEHYPTPLYPQFSDDGRTLYLFVQHPEDLNKQNHDYEKDTVHIWTSNALRIFPKERKDRKDDYGLRRAAWWPETDKTFLYSSPERPRAFPLENGMKYLSYHPWKSGSLAQMKPNIDLFVSDLKGEHNLLLANQKKNSYIYVSPNRRYIVFFKEAAWWCYDSRSGHLIELTRELDISFEGGLEHPRHRHPYGFGGWSKNSDYFFLFDAFDIWMSKPNGKIQKITEGRKSGTKFKIFHNAHSEEGNPGVLDFQSVIHDMNKGLIFQFLTKDKLYGYGLWAGGTTIDTLLFRPEHAYLLRKAKNSPAYIYVSETFENPPRLHYIESNTRKDQVLVGTNFQQKELPWGSSKLLEYPGPNGKLLQGILYYPAGYNEKNQYPMIVHGYEIQSHRLHHFYAPNAFNSTGFDPTTYTLDGYLVFYPDIKIELDAPGISAVGCIEAGINYIKEHKEAKVGPIGLIGYSYGGYVTAFSLSKSKMFSAGVAGAGFMDVVGWYHHVGKDTGLSEQWRFEEHQEAMSRPFHEIPEVYIRNSPLHQAVHITAPLLLWTGRNDEWVDWEESVKLYTSMRRMGKTCELLVYPGEKHGGMVASSRKYDITRRIKSWFDTYLKVK